METAPGPHASEPQMPQAWPTGAPHAPSAAQQPNPAPAQPDTAPPVLRCEGLSRSYGANVALQQLDLSVPKGRVVGLLGPNGSGKTTLIKLIAGLLTPTQGRVLVNGMAPGPATKAIVSYLPERPYFSPSMKVSACLDYFADFYADFDRALAADMLARLGVPTTTAMSTLSKGTKEKVQLTLVMARHAALYLLDEPIGGVDPAARDYILDTIIANYHRDSTILLSTHLVADVERVLDDFIFLAYGRLMLHAPASYAQAQGFATLDDFFRKEFRC